MCCLFLSPPFKPCSFFPHSNCPAWDNLHFPYWDFSSESVRKYPYSVTFWCLSVVVLSEAVKNTVSLSCPVASLLAICPYLSYVCFFTVFLMAECSVFREDISFLYHLIPENCWFSLFWLACYELEGVLWCTVNYNLMKYENNKFCNGQTWICIFLA